jgi:hypothetical protein
MCKKCITDIGSASQAVDLSARSCFSILDDMLWLLCLGNFIQMIRGFFYGHFFSVRLLISRPFIGHIYWPHLLAALLIHFNEPDNPTG